MGAQEWWGSQDRVEVLTLGTIGPESGGIDRAVAMEPVGGWGTQKGIKIAFGGSP